MVCATHTQNPSGQNSRPSRRTTDKRGARRVARELALKVLFDFQREADVRQVLDQFWANFRFAEDELGEPLEETSLPVPFEIQSFAESLVMGVFSNLDRIDEILKQYSANWTLERMARVDRAILRIGIYELLYCPQVPASVVINEAIEIAKRFGSKETPGFVNGILDQVARLRETSS